jgi:4-hydroxy-3-polyprenylbenzoate decarboxylase
MAYKDLRDFIAVLEREGELKRIAVEVDPILEIAAITDRVSKQFGPALLFEKPKGSAVPLLINAFGSEKRMAMAVEAESVDAVASRVGELLEQKAPEGMLEKIKMLPKLGELAAIFPTTVRSGACKEVVLRDPPSLAPFPILQCWPEDAGRFITMGCVFTKNPVTGKRNCGMYRMQVYDDRTTAMHWQTHKHGAWHATKAKQRGERVPVAVSIGCDPAVVFSAIVPLPDDLDEMIFAGFLRRKPVEMVRCETVDLEVPANAEIVLEGYVDPTELRTEGPFGDHTGFYSLADEFPVFHLTCVTHRRNPIYQTIIVGKPPQEDCHMGTAVERIFLPVIKKQLPEIVDMHLPWAGVFHNLMIVAIEKRWPGHARKVMNAIWGTGQMMFTKCIVVVDHDTNVRDMQEVAWKALNHIDPERDIQFTLGPVDTLEHASRLPDFGSKMGIDATRKWPSEGFDRPWPEEIRMSSEIVERVARRWKEYGF